MSERIMEALKELGDNSSARYQEILKKYDDLNEDVRNIKKKNGQIRVNSVNDTGLQASVGESLNNSENIEKLKSFISGQNRRMTLEVKDMSLTASLSGGTSSITSAPYGIVGAINRRFHVRDVLPKIAMTNGTLPIIKDNGATGNYETVAEGALKPSIDFALAEQPAKAEVIAGIVTVTRQFLDDLGAHGVMGWLQSRLTEMYLNFEDSQLLTGDGVSPNLSGVNDAGNFTLASSLVDSDVEQLVRGLLQMRSLQRIPTAIIIHPDNLSDILLNVAAGSGEYDLPSFVSVNATGGISILGVPVIDTVGQTANRFNILDSNQMLMGIREGFKIQAFEQDGDNIKYNKVTFRAESRVAFATYGAANTIQGTFVDAS